MRQISREITPNIQIGFITNFGRLDFEREIFPGVLIEMLDS